MLGIIVYYIFKTNQKLSKSEKRHKILFQNSASAGIVWKKGFIITDWNEQATRLFGWSTNEVLGKSLFELLVPEDEKERVKNNTDQIPKDTNLHIFTNKNILKNRSIIMCEWHNTLLQKEEANDDFEVVSLVIDVTQRLEEEEILKLQANNDFLTGLPNRHFFENILEKTHSLAKRTQTPFGLAFIDLDGFKKINDTHGHYAGDTLLKELAKRFQMTIRQEDTIARIGGDEFALIFHTSKEDEPYQNMIQRLLANASKPVNYNNIPLQVSASIGISFFTTENQASIQLLIDQADKAMYKAKREGKNCFSLHQNSSKYDQIATKGER